MIKTQVTEEDIVPLLELGYRFHQESQYRDTPYDPDGVLRIILAPNKIPDKMFIGFDDDYKGVIILQMSTQFFSGQKWAGDQVFYVCPEVRKMGLGHELLEAGAKWAKENGAEDLVILHNAGIGLDSAKQYYEREGFALSGMVFNRKL